jgi:glycosyltransferase involved in cell wall biosynthesis
VHDLTEKHTTKNILLHLTASEYGGVETHVYSLALALATRGVRVVLATQRKFELNKLWTNDLVRAGVDIVAPPPLIKSFPGNSALIIARLWLMLRLRARSFDWVIGNGHGGAYLWMKRFVKPTGQFWWHEYWYGVPTRGDDYTQYAIPPAMAFGWKMRRMVAALDGITTGCERARKNLVDVQGFTGPITIIPPLSYLETSIPAVDKHYDQDTPLNIVMVGRMGFGKGVLALLEAWGKIDIGPGHLHLYGVLSDDFRKRIAPHADNPTVHIHGSFARENLFSILSNSDMGLMLSIEEGYGLVALEYMASGLPFVMTDCGAAVEFTEHNPDAMMIPVSIEGIQEGIATMAYRIRANEVSRKRLQQLYVDKFSLEKSLKLHIDHLLGE